MTDTPRSAAQIDRPLFIIGAPRSGTTILFRCLALHKELWHLPAESHAVLEGPLHPRYCNYESNRVSGDDVSTEIAAAIPRRFLRDMINPSGAGFDVARWLHGNNLPRRIVNRGMLRATGIASRRRLRGAVRLLEKTPKNSLRVSALAQIFPDARFLQLTRAADKNIDSLISGWLANNRSGRLSRFGRFARSGYPVAGDLQLQDYSGTQWKFALPPRWRELRGKRVADAAALQFFACREFAARDLKAVAPPRQQTLKFEAFLEQPVEVLRSIFDWLELDHDGSAAALQFAANLPVVNFTGRTKNTALRYPAAVDRVLTENHGTDFARDLAAREASSDCSLSANVSETVP